jgi:hypothetical protein
MFVSNSILTEFLDEHKDVQGILDIQDNGIDRTSIIVFFDSKKLGKGKLPSEFNGCPVELFDVRAELKSVSDIVARIDASGKKELTNRQSKTTYRQFKRTIAVLEKLLQCK